MSCSQLSHYLFIFSNPLSHFILRELIIYHSLGSLSRIYPSCRCNSFYTLSLVWFLIKYPCVSLLLLLLYQVFFFHSSHVKRRKCPCPTMFSSGSHKRNLARTKPLISSLTHRGKKTSGGGPRRRPKPFTAHLTQLAATSSVESESWKPGAFGATEPGQKCGHGIFRLFTWLEWKI